MNNFLGQLRRSTAEMHEDLHTHPTLRDLMSSDLSFDYYKNALKLFYGFYKPFEDLYAASNHEILNLFPPGQNIKWLSEDLNRAGISFENLETIKVEEASMNQEQVLAYLYLREGSNLGGKVISRNLEMVLSLKPGTDNEFFWGNGSKTGEKWRLFQEKLCFYQEVTNIQKSSDFAGLLFAKLAKWLSQNESVKCSKNPEIYYPKNSSKTH